ncbi:hypothetical protein M378DRAFT_181020 [Amanita muscaria Koide BX008]|uniref:Zinc finger C3HC4 RING-type domain-containing protein n=1 Tax=Amanita muscaria (strain Koide BX008) TaxID=946122 RepID=A0A0C2WQQ2_AMAMK|nr:hypothetical protein M378DRAFT_181020 [Amanita muscaria Koide BX008]
MYEPEPGPSSSSRKRKRTDATASPRTPKRVAAAASDSSSSPTESETESDIDEDFHDLNVVDDDDQPLQYIDVPPESATGSTCTSLPQSQYQTQSPSPIPAASSQPRRKRTPATTTQPDFLSEYTCPICFSPPTNATLTPCGHICCGSCLFMAVKTTLHRGAVGLGREPNVAR